MTNVASKLLGNSINYWKMNIIVRKYIKFVTNLRKAIEIIITGDQNIFKIINKMSKMWEKW